LYKLKQSRSPCSLFDGLSRPPRHIDDSNSILKVISAHFLLPHKEQATSSSPDSFHVSSHSSAKRQPIERRDTTHSYCHSPTRCSFNMAETPVLRFPIAGQEDGSFLLEVSSNGSRPLDLKLIGSESTAVYLVKCKSHIYRSLINTHPDGRHKSGLGSGHWQAPCSPRDFQVHTGAGPPNQDLKRPDTERSWHATFMHKINHPQVAG
jgi:hypothetical protein